MRLQVNGQDREISADAKLEPLVHEFAGTTDGVAVAINAAVVPRSQWAQTQLCEGDALEILTARQGG